MEPVRCFIALDLPPELSKMLSAVSGELAQDLPSVRWVKPGNHHLTLRFLGDVEAGRLNCAGQAVDTAVAGHRVLKIGLGEIGGFPGRSRAKVIWQGIYGDVDELAALQRDLAGELEQCGFEQESRPFRPHLTLGRSRRPVSLPPYHEADPTGRFELSSVSLIRSVLGKGGAQYTALHTAALRKWDRSS